MALAVGNTNPQLTRTFDRVFEDAHVSGELKLSGRKLKEFPKVSSKHNLSDTVKADLSKNKFVELPSEVCEFFLLEHLDCYHNAIRSIPDSVITLHSLTYLNLSRNQLCTIPPALCQLPLQVLILSNNRLVSLPEEIDLFQSLMDLDVSCNEISILPPQIGDLPALRSFNVRRNQLFELRPEVCELRLVRLDISGNRIGVLPAQLRFMTTLQELKIDHNPLTSPPAFLCTRGRVHIFKYLEIQSIKEDKRRGVLSEPEFRRSCRKPGLPNDLRFQNGYSNDSRRKRYTVDSGYNTSDGSDKRWSQDLQEVRINHLNTDLEDARKLALRAAEFTKEQRNERERDLQRRLSNAESNTSSSTIRADNSSRPDSLSRDDFEFEENVIREDQVKTSRKGSDLHCQDAPVTAQDQNYRSVINGAEDNRKGSPVSADALGNKRPYPHIQTYKEYKEALRLQRNGDNNNVYGRRLSESANSSEQSSPIHDLNRLESSSPQPLHGSPEDEFRLKLEAMKNHQRLEAAMLQRRMSEEKQTAPPVSPNHYNYHSGSPSKVPSSPVREDLQHHVNHCHYQQANSQQPNHSNWKVPSIAHNGTSHKPKTLLQLNTVYPEPSMQHHFTMRREIDKAREEKELIENMKNIIESRLKVALPCDLGCALMDGVVLCHLANQVRPNSVSSIHVPSPAVPKLSITKCRRNVDNFLQACRRIGVTEELICTPQDILEERGLVQMAITVQELLKFVSVRRVNT